MLKNCDTPIILQQSQIIGMSIVYNIWHKAYFKEFCAVREEPPELKWTGDITNFPTPLCVSNLIWRKCKETIDGQSPWQNYKIQNSKLQNYTISALPFQLTN